MLWVIYFFFFFGGGGVRGKRGFGLTVTSVLSQLVVNSPMVTVARECMTTFSINSSFLGHILFRIDLHLRPITKYNK